ncbi:hypothetical protein KCG44_00500 [Pacificimonas sp. WHA3]|uniref:Lipoprotein n=1 Tax=Pacificimonas pallii TaxID=2827236 RepID=A0ABS6SAL7_9SPHN|nr:hypothetical protein [Pacificimonas pallii]MBV7255255.1 hypothetical protein [Pacificimonas pallii]
MKRALPLLVITSALALAACGDRNPLQVARSACPAVGILDYTGDTTLFSPATSRDADAIDLTATITNLRAQCYAENGRVISQASYDVIAMRTNAAAARTVTLPVFSAVMRAGDRIVSKQVGGVTLTFPAGSLRAQTSASARADIAESAATLPDAINREIDKRRKPGDPDAALDPLSRPSVRDAVREASFELLVGFNLDERALAYNVAK